MSRKNDTLANAQDYKKAADKLEKEAVEQPKNGTHNDVLQEETDKVSVDNTQYGKPVGMVEFALINEFLQNAYIKPVEEIKTDMIVDKGGDFGELLKVDYNYVDPKMFIVYIDGKRFLVDLPIVLEGNRHIYFFKISCLESVKQDELKNLYQRIRKLSFSNSCYQGKYIKINIVQGILEDIEIVNIEESNDNLILSQTQEKYVNYYIHMVNKGKQIRYLLTGDPGTGKTETMRKIVNETIPNATFIEPEFENKFDLKQIFKDAQLFDNPVVCIDDIDLYLGSRQSSGPTPLLGDFLTFFDGIKSNNISLLASTNDKKMVDKAAERPGRFNFTLDYFGLDNKQIDKLVDLYFPKDFDRELIKKEIKSKDKSKITGAFISNLADNMIEMSDSGVFKIGKDEIIEIIGDAYKGFYSSQKSQESGVGFK